MTDTDREAVEAFIQDVLKDHILSEGMTRNEEDTADTYKTVELLRALLTAKEAAEAERDEAKSDAGKLAFRCGSLEARAEAAEAERDEAINQLDSARHSVGVLERRCREFRDRAVSAEAKLAVAEECLEFYARKNVTYPGVGTVEFCGHDDNGEIARATLAQMKGTEDG